MKIINFVTCCFLVVLALLVAPAQPAEVTGSGLLSQWFAKPASHGCVVGLAGIWRRHRSAGRNLELFLIYILCHLSI